MRWFLWAVSMVVTQFFGTITSRARNTPSVSYHGVAAFFNHGSWFVCQVYLVDVAVRTFHNTGEFVNALSFYTLISTGASIAAHIFSMKVLERKGNRRVGTYEN